jgi:hypothetical protein
MAGQTNSQPPNRRPRSATPAERAVEFTATQRRLKQEAADRRDAAKDSGTAGKRRDGNAR